MPRTRMINLRVDDDEAETLQAAADDAGVKLASWIRDQALDAARPKPPAPMPVPADTDPMAAFAKGFALGFSFQPAPPSPWWQRLRFWRRPQQLATPVEQPELAIVEAEAT